MARLKLSDAVAALNPGIAAQIETRERKQPARPRLAPGEGDRLDALAKLADRGWYLYWYDWRGHRFLNADGRESAAYSTYRELIDALLKEEAT